MIDLVVVRHGETEWNRIRRLQGHTDIVLNAAGVAQAARLAAALVHETIVAIHSSDLARALGTAEPVAAALGLPIVCDGGLRERHYGILEGQTIAEIAARHPDEAERLRTRDAEHAVAGGESQRMFFRRAIDAVSVIAAREEAARGGGATILVVTHGGVLDMLYRAAHSLALDARRICPVPNAVINRIRVDAGRFTVRSWAEEAAPPQASGGGVST